MPAAQQRRSSGTGETDAAPARAKQAVVVIHGMGEQRPMATIRGFVQAVWSTDLSLTAPWKRRPVPDRDGDPENQSWVIPDPRTASHELRRITTPYDVNGRRTDFYELYWADVTQGNTLQRLVSWLGGLLLRAPSRVPPNALWLYAITWLLVLSAGAVTLAAWFLAIVDDAPWGLALVVTAAASILFWTIDRFVLPYFGDLASYIGASAATVERRAAVRERGLNLLRPLMEDPGYDRIVLVAHSLGSIIAYDLLQILWAEYGPRDLAWPRDRALIGALREAGHATALPGEIATGGHRVAKSDIADLRRLQWRLYSMLKDGDADRRKAWKVSDFVTVGSPLTFADFLLARNEKEFRRGINERFFSICPPISDKPGERTILYVDRRRRRHSHHAAVFAATRWTNIFDRGNGWLTGDPMSGRVEPHFGWGVRELQVVLRRKGILRRLFTHRLYWSLAAEGWEIGGDGMVGERTHIDLLREAVDIGRTADGPPVDEQGPPSGGPKRRRNGDG